MKIENAENLINQVIDWAKSEEGVLGVALVGSHARGEARLDSDIDLVIISSDPHSYIDDPSWISSFGEINSCKTEDWGILTSLRVFFHSGLEVEFGLSSLEWVAIPPDSGTAEVIVDGMKILLDSKGLLARLQEEVTRKEAT